MSDSEIIQKTLEELTEHLPQAKTAKLIHARVNRVPMAIHCPRPGTESLRPLTRPAGQNYVLAGDWIKTGLPSSMESACYSGFQAAEAVLSLQPFSRSISLKQTVRGPNWQARTLARGFARILRSRSIELG